MSLILREGRVERGRAVKKVPLKFINNGLQQIPWAFEVLTYLQLSRLSYAKILLELDKQID